MVSRRGGNERQTLLQMLGLEPSEKDLRQVNVSRVREYTQADANAVRELRQRGMSLRDISQRLGFGRDFVQRTAKGITQESYDL